MVMGEEEAIIAQTPAAAAEGTRWSASRLTRLSFVMIALLTIAGLQVVLAFIDAIHMTYYPQGGWVIW
jgi:hypothetical protein